ncbi:MAG: tRNA guanosine(15) transglycosylase TgtA [archaeon]
MDADFEIKDRDLAARIGRLRTSHGFMETPTILPVINPGKMTVKPSDMKKFGAEGIITNSYILWKNHQEEVLERGVHEFLGYRGPVMTDSGAFQLMEYGDLEVTNEEIIDFQKRIGVDIGVILDIPTKSEKYDDVERCVDETIKRARESQALIKDDGILWSGPVQGSIHDDLLKRCAKEMASLDFAVHPIGSVVPLLVQYKFAPHIKIIRAAKEILPANRPVHLFGAGHPMFFAFAVALGVDLFDSAAYALYAKDKRYLTQYGTKRFDELTYLPCSCPICSTHSLNEFNEQKLAMHNLYVTFEEIRTIKQAIRDKTLFELLEQRAHTHPEVFRAMEAFVKETAYISKYDPITKPHMFYLSKFSKHRTEFARAKKRILPIKSRTQPLELFGRVPISVLECYPFSQTEDGSEQEKEKSKNNFAKIRDVSLYWFGVNIFKETDRIRVSPKTKKIREVYEGGRVIASFRASDFMILLHEGAKRLFEKSSEGRVVVRDDVSPFIRDGKSVFAKHVVKCDKKIIPGQQVLVVSEGGDLLASGEAMMNEKEMKDFKRGVAVSVRWGNKGAKK